MSENISKLRKLALSNKVNIVEARMLAEAAAELEFLHFFYEDSDFGPAHEDVVYAMTEKYEEEFHRLPPLGYGETGEE